MAVKCTQRPNRISVAGEPGDEANGDFWSKLLEAGVRCQGLIRKDKWAREGMATVVDCGPGCQPSAVPAASGHRHLPPESKSPTLIQLCPSSSSLPIQLLPRESPPFFRSEVIWCSLPPNKHGSADGACQCFGLCSQSPLTVFGGVRLCCSSQGLSPNEPKLLPTRHFYILQIVTKHLFGNGFQNVVRKHVSSGTARTRRRYLDLLSDPGGPPSHVGWSGGSAPTQGKMCPFLGVSNCQSGHSSYMGTF